MKKVSARNFQLNAAKYLKELPIILTRNNIPIAMVMPFKDLTDEPPRQKIEYSEPPKIEPVVNVASIETPPMSSVNPKYPMSFMGRPLSGRRDKCPVCNEENIPIEFATKHYTDNHEDI